MTDSTEEEEDPEEYDDQLVYDALVRKMKDNVGTIIRTPNAEDERVRFSPHRSPKEHEHVLTAAIWVRQDRPPHSSKYKTYIYNALENGRGGYGRHSDGTYAETYEEAMEWIAAESEAFDGSRIEWLDLPRIVITEAELAEWYLDRQQRLGGQQ